jgi:hypothetical protein
MADKTCYIDKVLEQCVIMFHERDVYTPAYRLLTGYTLFFRRSREDKDPLPMIKDY